MHYLKTFRQCPCGYRIDFFEYLLSRYDYYCPSCGKFKHSEFELVRYLEEK